MKVNITDDPFIVKEGFEQLVKKWSISFRSVPMPLGDLAQCLSNIEDRDFKLKETIVKNGWDIYEFENMINETHRKEFLIALCKAKK